MTNYGVYVLPHDLKESIKTRQDTDDALVARYCLEASADVRRIALGREFHPILETRYYDYCNDTHLSLDRDLVEVTSFTTGNGGETIPSGSYFLKSGKTYGYPPYRSIELKLDGAVSTFSFSGTPQQANAVTGYWGCMPNWGDAWLDSGDTIDSISSTLLTVSNVDGLDAMFNKPRFKQFQLLKISDGTNDEFVFVLGKNQADNTLSIARGVNGTSALASPTGSIYVWQPPSDIARWTRRLALWYYRNRGNSRNDADRPIITPNGTVMPASIPQDIIEGVRSYRWVSIGY